MKWRTDVSKFVFNVHGLNKLIKDFVMTQQYTVYKKLNSNIMT